MINKWNFRTPTSEELRERDRLAADLGISPVISLLLVQRGITSADEAKRFFELAAQNGHPEAEKILTKIKPILLKIQTHLKPQTQNKTLANIKTL